MDRPIPISVVICQSVAKLVEIFGRGVELPLHDTEFVLYPKTEFLVLEFIVLSFVRRYAAGLIDILPIGRIIHMLP